MLLIGADLWWPWIQSKRLQSDSAAFDCRVDGHRTLCKGSDLAGTIARHPMHHLGGFFAKPRPFLPGDFVTTESGTGLVHMAPDHGEDDFALCKAHGIDPVFAVEGDGKYRADWAWLGGQGSRSSTPSSTRPTARSAATCATAGGAARGIARLSSTPIRTRWRSKAKVIYRCTPQWFVPMDKPLRPSLRVRCADTELGRSKASFERVEPQTTPARLRETALQRDRRHPLGPRKGPQPHRLDGRGPPRLGALAASAPGACRSRCSSTARPASISNDPAVNARIVAAMQAERRRCLVRRARAGIPRQRLRRRRLRARHRHSRRLVRFGLHPRLRARKRRAGPTCDGPADLYLEGSDQHRGWFQSSLARKLRHARPRALQGGADPRLHDGRQGHEDVQVARQHDRSAQGDGDTARTSSGCGRCRSISPRITASARKSSRAWPTSTASCATRSAICWARSTGFSEAERVDVADDARAGALCAGAAGRAGREAAAGGRRLRFQHLRPRADRFLQRGPVAPSSSISARIASIATRRPIPSACAYRTVLDTLFHALVRYAAPVLVFTAEEVWGTRYPGCGTACICWNGRSCRRIGATRRSGRCGWSDLRALRASR